MAAGCAAGEELRVTQRSVEGEEEGCTDQGLKGSELEASTTHSQSKDYSLDTRGSHRGAEDRDKDSRREGGRGTGIVQGKGLEVAAAALWCV